MVLVVFGNRSAYGFMVMQFAMADCEVSIKWFLKPIISMLSMLILGFLVRFYTREDTEDAVKYISGTILDDRPIRVDFDWGFQEGRQWGRGRSGGQVMLFTFDVLLLNIYLRQSFCVMSLTFLHMCVHGCWNLIMAGAR